MVVKRLPFAPFLLFLFFSGPLHAAGGKTEKRDRLREMGCARLTAWPRTLRELARTMAVNQIVEATANHIKSSRSLDDLRRRVEAAAPELIMEMGPALALITELDFDHFDKINPFSFPSAVRSVGEIVLREVRGHERTAYTTAEMDRQWDRPRRYDTVQYRIFHPDNSESLVLAVNRPDDTGEADTTFSEVYVIVSEGIGRTPIVYAFANQQWIEVPKPLRRAEQIRNFISQGLSQREIFPY